jgi:uncharacterized membrane protein YhiD involved in acid resistance
MEVGAILEVANILNVGVAGLFLVIAVYSIKYLFFEVKTQNEETRKYLLTEIAETRKYYSEILKQQEDNCRIENQIVRDQVKEVKEELRLYKNEDKAMVMNFVKTLSEDNRKLVDAVNKVTESINQK